MCSDGDGNEQHGEDGDASVSCNHEIICATAIVHSCNKDRPNNNCQDECLTENPPAESCENGVGVVNGVCGDNGTCLVGIYTAIPGWGDYWACLGSDNPVGNDATCTPDPVNGKCGVELGSCDVGLIGSGGTIRNYGSVYQWTCNGEYPEVGGTNASCSLTVGVCEWAM